MAAPAAILAQNGTTATLSGTVTDNSGAAVVGVVVNVHNVDTGIDRSTQTAGPGNYTVSQLPVVTPSARRRLASRAFSSRTSCWGARQKNVSCATMKSLQLLPLF